jgi:hypothetical protein
MVTELEDAVGDRIRERGREYGTTTGRPRRCGWFDGVAGRYAARINRLDGACISLLDVLDDFDEVRICTAYRLDGRELRCLPASVADAARIEPVYETLPGWKSPLCEVRRRPAGRRARLRRAPGPGHRHGDRARRRGPRSRAGRAQARHVARAPARPGLISAAPARLPEVLDFLP